MLSLTRTALCERNALEPRPNEVPEVLFWRSMESAKIVNDQVDGRTHDEAGVDLTLIRWMLSLSPAERLQVLQDNLYSILRLRGDDPDEA